MYKKLSESAAGEEMLKEYVYPSPVIAEHIQDIFNEHDLNDIEVGKILNIERKTIGRYRRGEANPSIKFIRWICSQYKIDANWLLDL